MLQARHHFPQDLGVSLLYFVLFSETAFHDIALLTSNFWPQVIFLPQLPTHGFTPHPTGGLPGSPALS
jgi:hypothetical protein